MRQELRKPFKWGDGRCVSGRATPARVSMNGDSSPWEISSMRLLGGKYQDTSL